MGWGWKQQSALFTDDTAIMYVTIGLMGAINGFVGGAVGYFVKITVLNLHASIWFFLLSWATTTAYLSYKRVPSGVLAVGLYFFGVLVLLTPVVVYTPTLVEAAGGAGTARTRLLIDAWSGMFRWGAITGVLALAIAFVGRLLKRHAQRAVSRRRTRNIRYRRGD